jgi:hypothetical protein
MQRSINLTFISVVCVAACTHDGVPPSKAATSGDGLVSVCPVSDTDDVRQFLEIVLDQKMEMAALLAHTKERGHVIDNRLFFSSTFDCTDRTLRGSRQYFVTAGWGRDRENAEVFRTFVVIPHADGTVKKIETRYSYKVD